MIEPEDLTVPVNGSFHNRLAINVPGAFDPAKAETIAARLSQLELRPVVGAYDAIHLQQIHARIFEDVFPWAGQFRAPESSSSLDRLFDTLARENRLKGLGPDDWLKGSSNYFSKIVAYDPFIGGSELASLELFRELASENNLTLCLTNAMSELFSDEMPSLLQQAPSNSLRRVLMLAVDPYPSGVRTSRGLEGRNPMELIASPDGFL